MNPKLRTLSIALIAVLAITATRAMSGTQSKVDEVAAAAAWTGEYYQEDQDVESNDSTEQTFEQKKDYYLSSPDVNQEVEDFEIDDHGNRIETPKVEAPKIEGSETPKIDKAWPIIAPPLPMQSFNFYNRGSLKNGTRLENDGKGFVKVFQDRDESIGGRGWGTRTLVDTIKKVAEDFMLKFPNHERLQIADMSKKTGGRLGHLSHQNGNEADIIYLRKNRAEQHEKGGFGKNGFLEQFVVKSLKSSKTYTTKDKAGKVHKRVSNTYKTAASENLDVGLTLELMKMFDKTAEVKRFFVDKVLIAEFFQYAKDNKLEDADTKSVLGKMEHQRSHADHFHLRLNCQSTDTKCVSEIAIRRRHASAKPKTPVKG